VNSGRCGCWTKAGQQAELAAGDHHRLSVPHQGAGGEIKGSWCEAITSPSPGVLPAGMVPAAAIAHRFDPRREVPGQKGLPGKSSAPCSSPMIRSTASARAVSITTGRSSRPSRSRRKAGLSHHHRGPSIRSRTSRSGPLEFEPWANQLRPSSGKRNVIALVGEGGLPSSWRSFRDRHPPPRCVTRPWLGGGSVP